MAFLKIFLKTVDLGKKIQQMSKGVQYFPVAKALNKYAVW